MHWKKIIKFGALLWVLMFVGISILGFIPYFASVGDNGFDFTLPGTIATILLSIIVSCWVGKLYFKKKTSFADGIKAFIPVLIVGLLLDIVITVPLFVKSYEALFVDLYYWVGIILGACAFALAGGKK